MPKKMPLLQWEPLDRTLRTKRPVLANRALIDFKTEEAWQARAAQMVRVRVRSRILPWRIDERTIPLAQEGDAELLDLTGVPGEYRSNRTPKLTRQIRNQESKATTYATLAKAANSKDQKSALYPLIVGVEIVLLGVMGMLGWAFAQNQSLIPIGNGGPVF